MDASKELAELARLGAAHRVQDLQRLLPSGLGHQVFTLTLGGHAQLPQHKALVVSVTDGAHDRKAAFVLGLRLRVAVLVTPNIGEPEPGAALPRQVIDLAADHECLVQPLLGLIESTQFCQRDTESMLRLAFAVSVADLMGDDIGLGEIAARAARTRSIARLFS